jgi:ABC-type cobalamin/Fe3+-siderophores transport system ATPase subunit
VAIVGPVASGKTTLLKLACGILDEAQKEELEKCYRSTNQYGLRQ